MLKVGSLVPFTVIKNMPDYDSYLVVLQGKGILAQIPKRFAGKDYRVGESGWAAVFAIKGARVTLSQKSPQYIRKMLEYVMGDIVRENKIRFKKVAMVSGARFCKVAVEPVENEVSQADLIKLCKPYLKEVRDYIPEQVTLVKYSRDLEEYVKNALAPAPEKAVLKVIHLREQNSLTVYVDAHSLALFLGKGGKNAATAAKLTGVNIEVIGI